MDLYGLIAVIIICVTLMGIVGLITTCTFSFKITRIEPQATNPNETTTDLSSPIGFVTDDDNDSKDNYTEVKENTIEVTSMDAVIKAANELMGIQTEDKERNDGTR